ncbi:SDR family NAD(P)-dependent oxidoreductase [Phycicoccus sonneratiae]|uniref:SDR family oxidoreductase n=1 Tax=Phycicoccus sonneratiae TaxID=2807628 RepID=A0ABS2CMN4_9MICO|nr:SDR family oxidoreductase [Phycicoccus sonneraticus]MBM6401133.1 SDR family oxidoreductase [Phycicoccus sonneraticus]
MGSVARTAVVTGGGDGLGRAVGLALARHGAHVVVADRDPAAAEATARDVLREGGAATGVACDVTRDTDLRALVAVADDLGGADVIVNNAGGWGGADAQYPEADVEQWSAVLDLNLRAPMLLLQLCLPGMRRRGWGRVVNVASSAALGTGAYGSPPYAAAKAGLIRLTTSLAGLADDGVRVTGVVPGWVGLPRAHAELAALDPVERAARPPLVPPGLVADEVLALVTGDAVAGTVVSLPGGREREVLPV